MRPGRSRARSSASTRLLVIINSTLSGALNPSSTFSNPESVTGDLSVDLSGLGAGVEYNGRYSPSLASPVFMQSMSSNKINELGGTSLIAVPSDLSLKAVRFIAKIEIWNHSAIAETNDVLPVPGGP